MKRKTKSILIISLLCCTFCTGCGLKDENRNQSNRILNQMNFDPKNISVDLAVEFADEDILSENDLQSENISQIAEKNFWNLVKRLCRLNHKRWNYEIFATDNRECALIVIQNGSSQIPFWLYQDKEEWHVENLDIPENAALGGNFDYAEFHWVESWNKEVMIMQTASNQGNGDTFAFFIEENRLKCIGYGIGTVCRHRMISSGQEQTSFYAGEGRSKIAFSDIDDDGIEEMLVYGKKLIYVCKEGEIGDLLDTEIEMKVYQYKEGNLVEMKDQQIETDFLFNRTTEKYYHLWGINAEVDHQILVKNETDERGILYSVNWGQDEPTITEIPIIGIVSDRRSV